MTSRADIFMQMQQMLSESFEIPAANITLASNLYEDLDLDSIDAVDMVIHLQEITGQKIGPDEFKTARTVEDVVAIVCRLMSIQD